MMFINRTLRNIADGAEAGPANCEWEAGEAARSNTLAASLILRSSDTLPAAGEEGTRVSRIRDSRRLACRVRWRRRLISSGRASSPSSAGADGGGPAARGGARAAAGGGGGASGRASQQVGGQNWRRAPTLRLPRWRWRRRRPRFWRRRRARCAPCPGSIFRGR